MHPPLSSWILLSQLLAAQRHGLPSALAYQATPGGRKAPRRSRLHVAAAPAAPVPADTALGSSGPLTYEDVERHLMGGASSGSGGAPFVKRSRRRSESSPVRVTGVEGPGGDYLNSLASVASMPAPSGGVVVETVPVPSAGGGAPSGAGPSGGTKKRRTATRSTGRSRSRPRTGTKNRMPALARVVSEKKRSATATAMAASPTPPRRLRLTREEEAEISESIRSLKSAVLKREEMGEEMGGEPSESEWAEACGLTVAALRRTARRGREARAKLVSAHAGLVTGIARRYGEAVRRATGGVGSVGSILTLQDMVQEGNLGLMEAAERFEPERGFRFSTYATYWVRQRILKSIEDYSRMIRLPAHVHKMLRKIQSTQKEMTKENGQAPSLPELAHRLNVPLDKLRLYSDSSRNVLSLEVPVNSNLSDRRVLGDLIASGTPTPEEDAQREFLKRDIRAVVEEELADRERDVVVARFGLDGGGPRSVEGTARELGISRDRVRTVEAKALNKLRHPRRSYRLKEYVGGGSDEGWGGTEPDHPLSESLPENLWSI